MANTVFQQLAQETKHGHHLFYTINWLKATNYMRQNYLIGDQAIEDMIDKEIDYWFDIIDILNLNQIKYARKCDVSGKGMNMGYCINNGEMYIKKQSDLIAHLKELAKEENPEYNKLVKEGKLTEDFLLNYYYKSEYYYWTKWDKVDNEFHWLEDGTYVETKEKFKLFNYG